MERPAAVTQPAEIPDLLYSQAENDLRQAVRSLLSERAQPSAVLARTETDEPYDTQLWRALAADMGCAGLLVPEALGGAGASHPEAPVVAQETRPPVAPPPPLGSALAPTPVLPAPPPPPPPPQPHPHPI